MRKIIFYYCIYWHIDGAGTSSGASNPSSTSSSVCARNRKTGGAELEVLKDFTRPA